MFGIVVSGRPVLTESQVVSPTQTAFNVPSTPPFSHIVVFLLPGSSLPTDTAAAVYAQLPGSSEYRLLGAIANEKPSAIFKVNNKAVPLDGTGMGGDAMTDSSLPVGPNVVVGISVEPAAQVAQQVEATRNQSAGVPGQGSGASPVTTKLLAQRIIANAYNFLASFSGNTAGGMEVVPLKSFQDWWKKFESRIERDPGFLEREQNF